MYLLTCTFLSNFLVWGGFSDLLHRAVTNVGAVIFVLGVLVFVHEFGHYAVAKLFGVRVEVFSLGFGKRLWGFRRGETDYRISLLPLGGYVKMTGENPMEEHTGDPGDFTSHPRWQRFLIAIAGPAMNIVLAIVVLTGVFMVHDEAPAFANQPARIEVVQAGSPADKAGIKAGDTIVQLGSKTNPTWQEVIPEVAISPKQPLEVTVERAGQTFHTVVTPRPVGEERIGQAGWFPPEPPVVDETTPGLPAEQAGIKAGDEIVALNDTPVQSMSQFVDLLQEAKSTPVQVSVNRNNVPMKFTVTPQFTDDGSGTGEKKYRIGFRPGTKTVVQRLPFQPAFAKAVATCEADASLLFRLVPRLLEAKNSIRQMSGPFGIMQESGRQAREGWPHLLGFMALLSVSLAVLNVLPFPILDGGLMVMLLIEGIMRRDIRIEIKERVYQAAFVALILFFMVVTYFDIAKSFHG
jgi:regulator of sigma E protease